MNPSLGWLMVCACGAFGIWFWFDSLAAREAACRIGRQTCQRANTQFLDDTVSLKRLRLGRDADGHLCLLRTYQFDYTDTGTQREQGTIAMLGHHFERAVVGDLIMTRDNAL